MIVGTSKNGEIDGTISRLDKPPFDLEIRLTKRLELPVPKLAVIHGKVAVGRGLSIVVGKIKTMPRRRMGSSSTRHLPRR